MHGCSHFFKVCLCVSSKGNGRSGSKIFRVRITPLVRPAKRATPLLAEGKTLTPFSFNGKKKLQPPLHLQFPTPSRFLQTPYFKPTRLFNFKWPPRKPASFLLEWSFLSAKKNVRNLEHNRTCVCLINKPLTLSSLFLSNFGQAIIMTAVEPKSAGEIKILRLTQ